MIRQSASQKYVREASRYLIGAKPHRARFIQLINESISACDDNESEIDYPELVQTLGEPKVFVENLMCGTPGMTLEAFQEAGKERRRRRIAVFAALAATAASITLALLGGFYIKHEDELYGGVIREGEELKIDSRDMPVEEFKVFMTELYETQRQQQLKDRGLVALEELLENQDLPVIIELLENYELSEARELLEAQEGREQIPE